MSIRSECRGPGAGLTPPTGVYIANQVYFYDAERCGNLPFEDGTIAAGVNAQALINIPTLQWVTPVEILGGRLGVSATVP